MPYPGVDVVEDYIRQAAIARGIDPNIAVRVAKSEGLRRNTWQSNLYGGKFGNREPSYGPFQLLEGGGKTGYSTGLGNRFRTKTGLDPSNPENWQQGIDFALDTATNEGWGAWYGAKGEGITGKMGIGAGARPRGVSPVMGTTLAGGPLDLGVMPGSTVPRTSTPGAGFLSSRQRIPGIPDEAPNPFLKMGPQVQLPTVKAGPQVPVPMAKPMPPMLGPQPGLSAPPVPPPMPKPAPPAGGGILSGGAPGIGGILSGLSGLMGNRQQQPVQMPDYGAVNAQAAQANAAQNAQRSAAGQQVMAGVLNKRKQQMLLQQMLLGG